MPGRGSRLDGRPALRLPASGARSLPETSAPQGNCEFRGARLVIRSVDSCCGAAVPQKQLCDGQVARCCSRVEQRPLICSTEQNFTGRSVGAWPVAQCAVRVLTLVHLGSQLRHLALRQPLQACQIALPHELSCLLQCHHAATLAPSWHREAALSLTSAFLSRALMGRRSRAGSADLA